MSAWTVYWVMQADNLVVMLLITLIICLFTTIPLAVFYSDIRTDKAEARWWKVAKYVGITAAISATGLVFIPSTRTLALMLVLPEITSERTISAVTPEAKELYDLAKKALQKAAREEG